MPTVITMPQLGESVSEGTIGRWLKAPGAMVKKDESLVEIITDKVTAELPSPVSGRLVRVLANEDQTVKVGAQIAEIEESGGGSGITSPGTAAGTGAGESVSSSATLPSANSPSQPTPLKPSSPLSPTVVSASTSPANGSNGSRAVATQEKVSPLARRMAQEHGLDLSAIQGTGEGGRVRKEDILAHLAQSGRPAALVAPSSTPSLSSASPSFPAPAAMAGVAQSGDEVVTPTPARRAIAEHMVRSKRTSPHAWTAIEVDMTGVARWLERNKDEFKRREGFGISFQTFVIKAAVEALKEHPYLNSTWTEDNRILLRKQINVGVSVALDNNLIVPVLANADTLNIAGIARTVNDLVARARSNKLMPGDVQGATFTVNNPGVFGTVISAAIINQPNAGILTMDAVVKRPVVVDDAIAIRQMMFLSLSFDHRVLDGLTAARFLGAIKRRLESVSPDADVY